MTPTPPFIPKCNVGWCNKPNGHDDAHGWSSKYAESVSSDPPEGLVPDPREPGCWYGEWTDRPEGYEQWRTDGRYEWSDAEDDEPHPRRIVQARPSQATTSPPRWTVEEDADGWNLVMADEDEDRIRALIGNGALALVIAALLNAADVAWAAAPQPQDPT